MCLFRLFSMKMLFYIDFDLKLQAQLIQLEFKLEIKKKQKLVPSRTCLITVIPSVFLCAALGIPFCATPCVCIVVSFTCNSYLWASLHGQR